MSAVIERSPATTSSDYLNPVIPATMQAVV